MSPRYLVALSLLSLMFPGYSSGAESTGTNGLNISVLYQLVPVDRFALPGAFYTGIDPIGIDSGLIYSPSEHWSWWTGRFNWSNLLAKNNGTTLTANIFSLSSELEYQTHLDSPDTFVKLYFGPGLGRVFGGLPGENFVSGTTPLLTAGAMLWTKTQLGGSGTGLEYTYYTDRSQIDSRIIWFVRFGRDFKL